MIVVDNGSTDGSREIAINKGVRVVDESVKGYGHALYTGIGFAQGKFVLMSDADDSYDLADISPFIKKLRDGYDFVIGNRYQGGIQPGAMPWLHRYLGNPGISLMGRMLYGCQAHDFLCGLRAFSKEAFLRLGMKTTGMEFCTEMVIKATLQKMKVIQIPTRLYLDSRNGRSHLRTWSDGWRNIRCILDHYPIRNQK